MKDYLRVRRGMVFSHNINQSVDKYNVPKIVLSSGKEIDDHLQYGWRDFLVISNDIGNSSSPTCNLVPITSQEEKSVIPTHVEVFVGGKNLTILCEQIYTANIGELTKYRYSLSDEVMSRVDDALATQLHLTKSRAHDEDVRMSLDMVEDIINGIISKKVEEMTKSVKAPSVDVEDAILRIGAGLENLFNKTAPEINESVEPKETQESPTPEKSYPQKSQVQKFYERYPDTRPKEKRHYNKSGKPRRRWTLESMREFMDDVARLSPTQMVKNYNFEDVNDFNRVKYYVMNRLEGETKSNDVRSGETESM